MDMIGQPENHCSFSLFCGYSVKKKTPYLWVLSCLYLIFLKNRPIVPDATLDQVEYLVARDSLVTKEKWKKRLIKSYESAKYTKNWNCIIFMCKKYWFLHVQIIFALYAVPCQKFELCFHSVNFKSRSPAMAASCQK